jgi:hypothetical protein
MPPIGLGFPSFRSEGNLHAPQRIPPRLCSRRRCMDGSRIIKNNIPTFWRNDGGNAKNWLMIRTEGVKSNRCGIGARILKGGLYQRGRLFMTRG